MTGIIVVTRVSFTYLKSFVDREIQPVLSTGVDCLSHYYQQQSDKTGEAESTEFFRAHCTPLPDRYKTLKDSDDLFAKVPRTNAAMRNSLKACDTLQFLTLLKNSYVVSNNPIDCDGNLSILKMFQLHSEYAINDGAWMKAQRYLAGDQNVVYSYEITHFLLGFPFRSSRLSSTPHHSRQCYHFHIHHHKVNVSCLFLPFDPFFDFLIKTV